MTSLHLSGHNIPVVRTRQMVCFVFRIRLRAQIVLIHDGKMIQTTPPGLSTSGSLHVKKVVETFRVQENGSEGKIYNYIILQYCTVLIKD